MPEEPEIMVAFQGSSFFTVDGDTFTVEILN
jgi:hypothetical protein